MVSPAVTDLERSPHDGRRMSLAEYEALPEEKPYLEYIDGAVVQKAVANWMHAAIAWKLAVFLDVLWRQSGGSGGVEERVRIGESRLLPDIAYWAPGKPHITTGDSLPPTLAVEIRSPDETMESQRAKCRRMRAHGVDVCWLVDPVSRSVERFEGEDEAEPFAVDGGLTSPHLPGFDLPLRDLFAVLERA